MAIPSLRLFFDTSVYIAALLSPDGAAGQLVRLVESGAVTMVVSEDVITESDRVLSAKFPELIQVSRKLWKALEPELVPSPSGEYVTPFVKKLPKGDAVILCAAHLANVSAFVTWNTRDFMVAGIQSLVAFPIVVPGDALKLFRKWVDPFLD